MVAQNMASEEIKDVQGTVDSCLCEYNEKLDLYKCTCEVNYDDGSNETIEENSRQDDGSDLVGTTYTKEVGGAASTVPEWVYILAIATFLSGFVISGFAMVSMHSRVSSGSGFNAPYYRI